MPFLPTDSNAVLLLSGGLDSSVLMALARHEGHVIHALTFDYGQKHRREVQAAASLAGRWARSYRLVKIDPTLFCSSALVGSRALPKHKRLGDIDLGIAATYVPARNTIFLAYALAYCEKVEAGSIWMGINQSDGAGYPDCRPEYVHAFRRLAGVSGPNRIELETPFLHLPKGEVVRLGLKYGADFANTISCYDPFDVKACGECDACLLRLEAFAMNQIPDPIEYR
jgi:7-cyano-7-deazaguanine synthase